MRSESYLTGAVKEEDTGMVGWSSNTKLDAIRDVNEVHIKDHQMKCGNEENWNGENFEKLLMREIKVFGGWWPLRIGIWLYCERSILLPPYVVYECIFPAFGMWTTWVDNGIAERFKRTARIQ